MEIKAPRFPESVNEGTVATWHKKPGDKISPYELIVEVETDKVLLEVVSPTEGFLQIIKIPVGKKCKSEQLLGIIVAQKEEGFYSSGSSSTSTNIKQQKLCKKEQKVDESEKQELKQFYKQAIELEESYSPEVRKAKTSIDVENLFENGTVQDKRVNIRKENVKYSINEIGVKRVQLSRLRQTITKRIVKAQKNAAMLTTYNEVDMGNILEIRTKYRELFEKKHGTKLGLMGFFVKACTVALKQFKKVNAVIDDKEIVYHNYQDIGIAVSTNRGLVVPILRHTDSIKIEEIEKKIMDFRKRGVDGKLSIKELTGGTFTISNGGVFGSLFSTPIINPPQTAILGMHKIQNRPVVLKGEIVIRPMMYLALSYDHRLIDGKDAVNFLFFVKELLEQPIRFILNI
ncbi:2-oxoglutarate dehydrogenase complex dihydrolipoyllysine-residue succinyltransferase [Candidatus Portiera aleyrodidarum]|uniref:2-oxoglutarate dehydrogenase complex dihydrolipoyllysine-residue succinyltransferase n=1 Tax=Candidatus Portiera aleyrodidarum TaxID=91844 RepID=UPI003A5987C9